MSCVYWNLSLRIHSQCYFFDLAKEMGRPLLSELYLAAPARWEKTVVVVVSAQLQHSSQWPVVWLPEWVTHRQSWAPAIGGAELIGTKQSLTSSEKHGIVVKARRAPWICRSEAERAQAVPGNQRPEAANVVVARALWWSHCQWNKFTLKCSNCHLKKKPRPRPLGKQEHAKTGTLH